MKTKFSLLKHLISNHLSVSTTPKHSPVTGETMKINGRQCFENDFKQNNKIIKFDKVRMKICLFFNFSETNLRGYRLTIKKTLN